jgi:hypothetical protein
MPSIQIQSAEQPFRTARIAHQAAHAISKAAGMGLLEGMEIHQLDLPSMRQVVDRIAEAGIGREVQATFASSETTDSEVMAQLLTRLDEALETCPSPPHEWRALEAVFGSEVLARRVGVSSVSVRRYLQGERETPDVVAARLHYLATLVGDLSGAYNDFGIRRWFDRPRTTLDGKSPGEILSGDWDPEGLDPRKIRALAASLQSAGAT